MREFLILIILLGSICCAPTKQIYQQQPIPRTNPQPSITQESGVENYLRLKQERTEALKFQTADDLPDCKELPNPRVESKAIYTHNQGYCILRSKGFLLRSKIAKKCQALEYSDKLFDRCARSIMRAAKMTYEEVFPDI
jgi:hypothetical protein